MGRRENAWRENGVGGAARGSDRRSTYYEFDAVNRVTKMIDPEAVTGATRGFTTTQYDLVGNRERVIDQEGRTAYYTYDALDRQVTRKNGLGNVWTTVYDGRSAATRQIDPDQNSPDGTRREPQPFYPFQQSYTFPKRVDPNLWDSPGWGGRPWPLVAGLAFPTGIVQNFETCAICLWPRPLAPWRLVWAVLGCVSWAHSIEFDWFSQASETTRIVQGISDSGRVASSQYSGPAVRPTATFLGLWPGRDFFA